MRIKVILLSFFSFVLLLFNGCSEPESKFQVPIEYYKLDNGLKVVLSQDKTTPIVTVAVYYNIGFRIEPKDRTGFAHLFEHMMFQGSQNLPKGEFDKLINYNGGILNGSTRFDFTNYFEIMPAHKLETILWAEADRMKGLNVTQENLTNQQGVVVNEVKVNVLNQPYGGFPWLDLPQYANTNWFNSHNFYGDLEDIEAANLTDVKSFFDTYYSPNNAVLVVVGDFETNEAKNFIKKYFENIPSSELPPKPDLKEPKQEQEKFASKVDNLASRPALAFAYHVPERNTPEYFAMGLLNQILVAGNDSKLYQKLVNDKAVTGNVSGGINLLGNMYNYNGPMLWTVYLFHDNSVTSDSIMALVDDAFNEIIENPIDQKTLDRAKVKIRSEFYDEVDSFYGFGKADLLASYALFEDNPNKINSIEDEFKKVTPELIQKTAKEFLRNSNRTVLTIIPNK
ncbi:MAG: insulinase family protein [Ignavibacteriales bacterium]|nr:insulinase family protein [Ignavibacteriales bacterium]